MIVPKECSLGEPHLCQKAIREGFSDEKKCFDISGLGRPLRILGTHHEHVGTWTVGLLQANMFAQKCFRTT